MQFSIVQFSNKEPISLRLDAEYYRPIFLDTEEKLKAGKWTYLENLTKSIKSFGAYSLCNQVEYKEEGIPFLRCKDIKNGFIDFSDVLYIDSDANNLLWKSEVKPKTVLFTMSGTVGNSAIATEKIRYPINSNQDIAKITTNDKLNPYYFSIFLQSAHGKRQITRLPVGSVQQHIFLWQLEKLVVPLLSVNFQVKIENIFRDSLFLQEKSIKIFKESQTFLLSELDLANWQPQHQLTFVKNYSDTEKAERIDAEYFQPKYDELLEAIKNNSEYTKKISEIQTYNARGLQPKYSTEGTLDVITSKHILENELDFDNFEKTDTSNWDTQRKAQIKNGDILTYTTGANIGRTAAYLSTKKALASNHVNILRIKDENPEYVSFAMNSLIGRLQTEQMSAGSAQAELYPKDIDKFIIPFIKEDSQDSIISKLSDSQIHREQSSFLLECAKRAVEIAIEQDEQSAINWLKEQTRDIGVIDAD